VAFERVEAAGQLGPVGLEPLVELSEGFGPQAVDPALGIPANLDEAGFAQDLEMAGHTGLMHADGVDELGDRTLAASYGVENAAASRFGDHPEDVELTLHHSKIQSRIYMCNRMSTRPTAAVG